MESRTSHRTTESGSPGPRRRPACRRAESETDALPRDTRSRSPARADRGPDDASTNRSRGRRGGRHDLGRGAPVCRLAAESPSDRSGSTTGRRRRRIREAGRNATPARPSIELGIVAQRAESPRAGSRRSRHRPSPPLRQRASRANSAPSTRAPGRDRGIPEAMAEREVPTSEPPGPRRSTTGRPQAIGFTRIGVFEAAVGASRDRAMPPARDTRPRETRTHG